MPRPNLESLPIEPRAVRDVTITLPVGSVTLYLIEPDLPQYLAIQSDAETRVAKWCRPNANAYPVNPPVAMSRALWDTVCGLVRMQCDPTGMPLPPDDRWQEHDFILLAARASREYLKLTAAGNELIQAAGERWGNSAADGAETSSAPPSTPTSGIPTT